MKKDCECNYCKNNVNKYFCGACWYNFNECESFHKYQGITLCPKCHPLIAINKSNTMNWISVEDELPPNRQEVLALVWACFPNHEYSISLKKSHRVFQASFFRSHGWTVPYCPEDRFVKYWMPLPDEPNCSIDEVKNDLDIC